LTVAFTASGGQVGASTSLFVGLNRFLTQSMTCLAASQGRYISKNLHNCT
jgi:hypothetical protein